MSKLKNHILVFILMCSISTVWSQDIVSSDTMFALSDTSQHSINIDNFTKEDVQRLTMQQLLDIPLDQLVQLSQKLGISVSDLLNMKINVSKSDLTPRESPSIISVITEEDIKSIGARDLIDVLRLIPGYSFGYDDQGVIGVGSRGLWAHEGKMLMLIDGQEMNELFYSTIPISNHYPLENIKRIEIIRGPGSSIYGGNAELGVINIITKSGDDMRGATATTSYGQMKDMFGRKNISLMAGHKVKDFDFAITGFYSEANKTTKNHEKQEGLIYPLNNGAALTNNSHVNVKLKYKNLKTNFIYDDYATKYDSFQIRSFKSFMFDSRYDLKFGKKLTITPRLNYKNNTPYFTPKITSGFNKNIQQYLGGITVKYDIDSILKLVVGTDYVLSNGKVYGPQNPLYNTFSIFNIDNKANIHFYNQAYYLQALVQTDLFNITLGGRYDIFGIIKNNNDGVHYTQEYSAFAPRIGITKAYEKFHYKFLVSKAFRTPSLGILYYDKSVRPENTYIQELELGYIINKKMYITANLFNINIDKPIIYSLNHIVNSTYIPYFNYKQLGTQGAEVEFKYKSEKFSLTANYSYYQSGSWRFLQSKSDSTPTLIVHHASSEVSNYQGSGMANKSYLIGFPNHKLTLSNSIHISKHISISNSFIFMSKYSSLIYTKASSTGYDYVTKNPCWMWNIFFEYNNIIDGLSLGAGVYDILDKGPDYSQPYIGVSSAYPGPTREFIFRLTYNFSFEKDE